MVKHIVMWKLKDFAEGSYKTENAKKIKSDLEGLREKIEAIKFIEVGINFNTTPQAYDVVLYSEFDNKDDLNTYQNHPEHIKVSQFVGNVKDERVVIDYEA